ncbi:hypothetical protein GGQ74_002269 [Desulfobaculum xiamenense]|uniref:Uncharacterized protein n=1 Tax=Desulfobaculum xiamenense TaxID=995050 RepID=A0A846QIB3_9BACT|nr:hypothetical protein [Desulfobaculum xiamenense]NJB68596.1 hypothetical protein [Desulfobaculum xiamenense]
MDPATLVPAAGIIQVEWQWFQGLLLVTFVAHLLLMNALVGSAVMALAEGLGHGSTAPVCRHVSRKLPTVTALTVNFGVAPLLFMQVLYGQFFYVSDILMGVYWLAVVALIIIAYYASYLYDFRFDALRSRRTAVLFVVVLALLAVAFLFVNNLSMMLTPERWVVYFENPGGTVLNFAEPTLVPRYLHFVLASVAVGGLVQALYWSRPGRRGLPGAVETAARGMRAFAYATAAQVAVGSWWLVSMPREVMLTFMGGSALHTVVFLAALAGAAVCLVLGFRGRPGSAAWALVVTVAVMAVLRELVRVAYLAPYYRVAELPSQGQHSPMVMFVVALVIGLGVIGFVLKLASGARRKEA